MKKTVLFLLTACLIMAAGCSEENIVLEQPNEDKGAGNTLSVTAGIVTTRVALERDVDNISLEWEVNDKIYFVFVDVADNTNRVTAEVTLTADDINGQNATFQIPLPDEEDIPGNFDLYGLVGGNGFTPAGEIQLPVSWSGNGLTEVQDEDIVLLRFEATNISRNTSNINVAFNHIGSLFSIKLDNMGATDITNLTEVQLVAADGSSAIWAYQPASTTVTYDPVGNSFTAGTTNTASNLSLKIPSTTLTAGESIEIWGWFPPEQGTGKEWPALGLKVIAGSNEYVTNLTTDTKPARTPATGKAYHFVATYSAGAVAFVNAVKTIQVPHPGGTLSSLFSDAAEQRNVSRLTITGTLSEDDWGFLKGVMQGTNSIRFLDLSGLSNTAVSSVHGQYFFQNNQIIEEVRLPAGFTTLQSYFFHNSSLKKCDLPSGLTSMSREVFHNSKLSGKVVVPSGVTDLNDFLFLNTNITEVVLHEGVTIIRNQAFANTKLTQIVLPSTVQEIGYAALSGIKTVYSKSPTPPKPRGAISTFGLGIEYIGVPTGSVNAYKTADNWKNYADKIHGVDFDTLGL